MPETKPSKTTAKTKASKPVVVTLEFDVYPYPCALCGKSSVGWTVNGDATIHPANDAWIRVPLKHTVCGQKITLDIKKEELKIKQDKQEEIHD